jgi:hypothetical protein
VDDAALTPFPPAASFSNVDSSRKDLHVARFAADGLSAVAGL